MWSMSVHWSNVTLGGLDVKHVAASDGVIKSAFSRFTSCSPSATSRLHLWVLTLDINKLILKRCTLMLTFNSNLPPLKIRSKSLL